MPWYVQFKKTKGQSTFSCKDNSQSNRSSRLEWAESCWIRWPYAMLWCWITPLLVKGYRNKLNEVDLDDLPYQDTTSVLSSRLEKYDWGSMSTIKIIIQEFYKEYIWKYMLVVFNVFVRVIQPLLLRQIILYIYQKDISFLKILTFVLLLCSFGILQSFFEQKIYFDFVRLGVKIRNALSCMIYKQALLIKSSQWRHITTSKVINLITNDTTKFKDISARLYIFLEAPIELLSVFGILCWVMKPIPVMVGFSVILILVIVASYTSKYYGKYYRIASTYCDKRIHAFNELIHGYYILKMQKWEKPVENQIKTIRNEESKYIRKQSRLRITNNILQFTLPSTQAITIFGAAWLLGYRLNVADCFTAISLFALARSDFLNIMYLVTEAIRDVQFSTKRIDEYMRLHKHDVKNYVSQTNFNQHSLKSSIFISEATFTWSEYGQPCLSLLTLTIQSGTFVGVTGPVGSGKSSLLAAILGELTLINGQIDTNNSSFSYYTQSSWIFADTFRNNILLNQSYDEQRYRHVIFACCLDIDIKSFGPNEDLTIVGERGLTLSGGQKARIGLARALYAHADVYLLDDPFASVDRNVARQIYERCFSSKGLLHNKTLVLVTHQTEYLRKADQIIYLEDGKIIEKNNLEKVPFVEEEMKSEETSKLKSLLDESPSEPDTKPMMIEETVLNGKERWNVLYRLFSAPPLGIFGLCLLIVLLLSTEILYHGGNYCLSVWLKNFQTNYHNTTKIAFIYFGLVALSIFTHIIRTCYFYWVVINGADHLFYCMLQRLLRVPMYFYEQNPSGRILSRVSKDQNIVDGFLPRTIFYATKSLLLLIGSIIITCVIRPYVLFIYIIIVPVILFVLHVYLKTKRQLNKFDSISRSPPIDIASSSLNGLITIRAFNSECYFTQLFAARIDRNTRAYINSQVAMRWFSLYVRLITFINILVSLTILIMCRHQIDTTLIVLGLTYFILIPKSLQIAIQQTLDADFWMTSADRIYEYAQLASENNQLNSEAVSITSPEWPIHGTIEFRHYSLRHQSDLQPALNNINIRIESGENIGIIGRTGAGKSSLFKGLFRFIDQSNIQGQILIDNVDISQISLDHLRSHLSIIPQQSIIFDGTLRYNLDPMKLYSDEECWNALEDVQLKEYFTRNAAGLETIINESGNNLSVGQCQLISIARAILKKSKILLIDEATSNVDCRTDEIIQDVIANKFRNETVLIIAHRLCTVAKCDRILVLNNGSIVNFDVAANVLQNYQ